MTSSVTSIARVRAAARDKASRIETNNRVVTIVLAVVVVLVVIGLGATQSASSVVGINQAEDRLHFFKRQLFGVGIGTLVLLVASRIKYTLYRRVAVPSFILTLALLGMVLKYAPEIDGARRWLPIAGFTFQPSELSKAAVIVTLAYLLDRKHKLLGDFGHFLVPVLFVLGTVGLLVMGQPDLGTMIVIAAAGLAVIVASEAPMRFVALTSFGAVGAATLFAFGANYRLARIQGFLDPWNDVADKGYQVIQGYYALTNGGLFGVGLGMSRARWFYLPNAHTDFIFAIIGEETGLIGAMAVIGLFLTLGVVGWFIASRAPDRFGRMLAAGITVWLSFQALVNIGGVLGVLPITGIALPFVSFGSTALIVAMRAIGVLVNIAQAGVHRKV